MIVGAAGVLFAVAGVAATNIEVTRELSLSADGGGLSRPYVSDSIAVGENPEHLALYGSTAFVADLNGTVRVVDLGTSTVQGTIPAAANDWTAVGLVVDERSHTLVMAVNDRAGKGHLVLIDAVTRQTGGIVPLGRESNGAMAIDPGLRAVYVTAGDDGAPQSVVAVDLDTRSVTGEFALDAAPGPIAVDRDTHSVYVSGYSGVWIFDGVTGTRTGTIDTIALGLAVHAGKLYATNDDPHEDAITPYNTVLTIVDLSTRAVTATVRSRKLGHDIAFDTSTGIVYVTNAYVNGLDPLGTCSSGFLTLVDPLRGASVDLVCLGGATGRGTPTVIDPVTHRAYVLAGDNLLVVTP
ncbi:YncE family protein [Nocardia sp. NPDC127526]|uniref:YncE family protein n=1 Tax=Nocardia sp. NPDC127526 TaxID=3345393 RepID=UPI00362906C8